jgi:hypothetical protein
MAASTNSYRALVERLRDLDGAVFTESEAQQLREAADARLFGDADQGESVRLALEMLERLVEAARLSSRTSHQLSDLLREIQPVGIGS